MKELVKQLKNYDHVSSQDFEVYMKKGIIEFWATVNTFEDQRKLIELSKKYNYSHYSTAWINVDECIKRGATFEDRGKQIKNHNLGEY